ncbi:MAG: oligosaccharide flippase family protein [Acidobacteria bacterium]|jgi:O-antigen/teichoic acid export membrane protein|nr:oligosaccharide flippase family protein [Acidobacteriota bacterium]
MSGPAEPVHDDVRFVAREGGWAGLLGAAGAAARYLNSILLARVLGSAGYGLFALASTVVNILAMPANMGLPVSSVHFVAASAARRDWAGLRWIVATSLRIVAVSSVAWAAVVVAAAPWGSRAIFDKEGLALPLIGLALSLPLLGLNAVAGGCLQGLKEIRAKVIVEKIAHPAIFSALLLALFAVPRGAGRTLPWVLAAFFVAAAAVAALSGRWLSRRMAAVPPAEGPEPHRGRELFAFATPVMLLNLLNQFVLWSDVLVMGVYRSAAEIGVYHVATRLGTAVNMPTEALNTSLAPSYAGMHGRGDRSGLERAFHTSTRWIFSLSALIALVVVLAGRPLLRLFGAEFEAGHLPLALIALGQLASGSMGTNGMLLTMTGYPHINLANAAIVAAISLGLNALLVPAYGATGAAAAAAASLALINAVRCAEIWVMFRIVPWDRTILKPLAAFLLAAGLGAAVFFTLGGVPAAMLALAVFAGAWWLLGLELEDRELLSRALARLRSPRSR